MKPAVTMMVGLMLGWGANPGADMQAQQAGDQQTETPKTTFAAKLASTMNAIVLIKIGGGHGTGVIVDAKRRLVITNAHVVRSVVGGRRTVTVKLRDGTEVAARVIYRATGGLDLAMVQLEPVVQIDGARFRTKQYKAVTVGCRLPRAPERVTAIGHPGPFRWAVSQGHVAGEFTKARALGRGLVLDLTIWHGNSGGGLFDRQGKLVGITTAIFGKRTRTSRVYSGFSFAISGAEVCTFVKRMKAAYAPRPDQPQVASR
jgi:serine protease Do